MKNVIFYFSGTGNSMQVAEDIAHEIEECDVINLAKYDKKISINAERVGIVFPVYFWGVPNIIKAFLKNVEFVNDPYIFAIATCGGTAGASLIQVNRLLKLKNQKLSAGFFILMPDNYIMMFNPGDEEKQQKLFDEEKMKISVIKEVVLNKKEQAFESSKLIIDRFCGNAINNLVVKKYPLKDYGFNVNEKCIGCGKCKEVCSVSNIEMINGKPNWKHHCEFCLGCLNICPVQSINYKNKTQNRSRYINPNVKIGTV
ncbi:MAG: EFR1 family ferrodoxin [Bacillota bacterium]|nr:EFR1 family ferrodoxin [Bacillota bacterium]